MENHDWYRISQTDQLDSPALLFYPERILENISRLKASINDIGRLRPHVKTHKNAEVTALMIQAGISKFKCATISEAEMLGLAKAPDVLLAYQPVGPKIDRFIELIKVYPATHFSCLVDNPGSLTAIANAALKAKVVIDIYLDLNVGMNRTGIMPDEKALSLYQQGHLQEGVNIIGLHAYDGHIHDADFDIRKEKVAFVLNAIRKLQQKITDKGLPQGVIVAGGTPTYPFYALEQDLECSPGTFILWDKGYQDAFKEQDYLTAALLFTRVISVTSGSTITVDLGHKAVAAENDLHNRVSFLNAAEAKVVGQSEEHLVLNVGVQHGFKVGDILYGLPVHVCPTVALHQSANTVETHQVTGEWAIISRNRKINI